MNLNNKFSFWWVWEGLLFAGSPVLYNTMKNKPKSKNQTLKTSFKAPLVQQMPYKERPRRIVKNKKIDETFS